MPNQRCRRTLLLVRGRGARRPAVLFPPNQWNRPHESYSSRRRWERAVDLQCRLIYRPRAERGSQSGEPSWTRELPKKQCGIRKGAASNQPVRPLHSWGKSGTLRLGSITLPGHGEIPYKFRRPQGPPRRRPERAPRLRTYPLRSRWSMRVSSSDHSCSSILRRSRSR